MDYNAENRDYTRFDYEVSLLLENVTTGSYYDGRMFNFCNTGMYLETDFPLEPGSHVNIVIEDLDPLPSGLFETIYNAKVRWCKKLRTDDADYYYGVGVKYY